MKAHKFAHFSVIRTAMRAISPYGSVRTVRRGRLKARRFVTNPGADYTYRRSVQGGEWDWVQQVDKGGRVYDIDANCGQSTLYLADAVEPGGMVVAFEPTPDSCQSLVRNSELNVLEFVTPVCAAVAAAEGVAQFQLDRRRPTMGRLSPTNADLTNAEVMEIHQLVRRPACADGPESLA